MIRNRFLYGLCIWMVSCGLFAFAHLLSLKALDMLQQLVVTTSRYSTAFVHDENMCDHPAELQTIVSRMSGVVECYLDSLPFYLEQLK